MGFWRSVFSRSSLDRELDSELRFHIDSIVEEKIAEGLDPSEARRQATLEFGGREQIKEELRDLRRLPAVETTIANLRWALRLVAKTPSLAATIVLTFALGVGANSAVFSAIDRILLRPLPFPEADRLMSVSQQRLRGKTPNVFVAPVRLEDWNRGSSAFAALTGCNTDEVTETTGSLPEKRTVAFVAPRFLQVWGTAPALGRDFRPEEQTPGGPAAVLISDRFWRTRFGADPSVVGRTLRLSSTTYTVVGVLPPSFRFPSAAVDAWSPVRLAGPLAQNRRLTWYTVVGRLRGGVTLAQARADLATVQARLGRQFPDPDAELTVAVEPLKEQTVGGVRRSLWVLFGSVSLLLVIACANIAALLLARSADRRDEIAIRHALGASRSAIVSQLLTETAVLGLGGAAVGLAVAWLVASAFRSYARGLPRADEVALDWRIALYTVACGLVAALAGGLLPALRASRTGAAGAMPHAGRAQVSTRNPLQWTLVGVQVALAVTLLAGAGLLLRSLQEIGRVAPGFETSHVLAFRVSGSWGESADMNALVNRVNRTLDALRNLPGVEAAATASGLPGASGPGQTELTIAGQIDPDRQVIAGSRFVSAGYFATMRIPLLAGEPCRDDAGAPSVVVNRSFAERYLPGSPAIGRMLRMPAMGMPFPPGEIRGVVADAREAGLDKAPSPTVYWCHSAPSPTPDYLVRTSVEPLAMVEAVRKRIREVEPARSVSDTRPLDAVLHESFGETRLRAVLLASFAATALALACVGLYGTLSYFVSVRRREVGLRVALGATARDVASGFLLRGLAVSLAGCLSGLLLAAACTRLLSGMLYGVRPLDPLTFGGSASLLLVVAALASLRPALRAARLQPMQVLREE